MDFPQGHCKCNEWEKRGGDDCSYQFCLNECSSHGTCTKGKCKCFPNYYGEDCSVFVVTILKKALVNVRVLACLLAILFMIVYLV